MGMLGSAIGSGIQAAGAIFGGISASRSAKKQKKAIKQQQKKNQEWYDQRYNEDNTQRADAQRMLTQTQDAIRRQNQAAAGSAAIMGSTPEAAAAAKAANNSTLSDAAAQIAAQGANRQDQIEGQYMKNDDSYVQQLNNIEAQKQQNIAEAVNQLGEAAVNMGGAF